MAVPGQRGLRRARSGPPRRPGSRQRSSLIVGRRGGEPWGAGYVYDNVLVTRSSQGGVGSVAYTWKTGTVNTRAQPRHSHGHIAVTGTATAQPRAQRSHGHSTDTGTAQVTAQSRHAGGVGHHITYIMLARPGGGGTCLFP